MTKVTGKEVVTLNAPIVRGKTAISEITITPVLKQAGSLRGLKVYDVLTSNYDALVADIAVIFHWRPAEMDAMTVEELLLWRDQAAARSGGDQ